MQSDGKCSIPAGEASLKQEAVTGLEKLFYM